MPITLDPRSTPCAIRLSGAIDIRCAAELKGILVEALSLARGVHVELSGVTEVDLTALQLLWVAQRDARGTGGEFTFDQAMPEAILAALKDAWLKFPIPLPMPMPIPMPMGPA